MDFFYNPGGKIMVTQTQSHEEFCKIAKNYKSSLKKINKKITEITDKSDLTILNSMARDLKESIQELENYYKGSYWRSEKITMNARKAAKMYFNIRKD